MTEWDAASYHRIARPQTSWGESVLSRLTLRGDETVMDAGCGTGRLTAELLDRLPRGRVIAVDGSENMLRQAEVYLSPRYGDRVTFLRTDLTALAVDEPVDAIFSTATFHWITDHALLFRRLYAALKPNGRLEAQCGGQGNLDRVLHAAAPLMASPRYAAYFEGWMGPWEFAGEAATTRRLRDAGFTDVAVSMEERPTIISNADEYREFLATVIFRLHLERLPDASSRADFLGELTEQASRSDTPFLLDYQRLNLTAQRPADEK